MKGPVTANYPADVSLLCMKSVLCEHHVLQDLIGSTASELNFFFTSLDSISVVFSIQL
jgi:hypothetical protein